MLNVKLNLQTPKTVSFGAKKVDSSNDKSDLSGFTSMDLTKLYTQKEIKDILIKVGTLKDIPGIYPARYSMQYLPKFGDVVINNKSMTNDTTIITLEGGVRHCGSWHNKEIAPDGTHTDIIGEVLERIIKSRKQNN